jgi:hypothetical protein
VCVESFSKSVEENGLDVINELGDGENLSTRPSKKCEGGRGR